MKQFNNRKIYKTNLPDISTDTNDFYVVNCIKMFKCTDAHTITKYTKISHSKQGEGGFGYVQLCKDTNNKTFAFKTMEFLKTATSIPREVNSLQKIYPVCANYMVCIKNHGFEENTKYPRYIIVMEDLSQWKNIQEIFKKKTYDEKFILQIINKLCAGLLAIHDQGVSHFDIKDNNIMYLQTDNDVRIKYIDFGLSSFNNPTNTIHGCDNIYYDNYKSDLGIKFETRTPRTVCKYTDYWQLGLLIYSLLFWNTKYKINMYSDIDGKNRKYILKQAKEMFDQNDIIKQCKYDIDVFHEDPKKRKITLKSDAKLDK
jgi:serine/threonine protein kinase